MDINKSELIKNLASYLPSEIVSCLLSLDKQKLEQICEIRIRADMPVVLVFTDGLYYLTKTGRITQFRCSDLIVTDRETVVNIFTLMCRFSVYSYSEQIRKGFISLDSGIRVGVYGTAVTENDEVCAVRQIRGMNIRIPVSCYGCSDSIVDLFNSNTVPNLLICGPPACGKTTVLKDLCRSLSERFSKKVCVIDERFEFESCSLGTNTDILSGYPKAYGIEIAVRTLSPDVIIIDELGMNGEIESIIAGFNSGVKFIMSMHCSDRTELCCKRQFRQLTDCRAVDYCVFIREKSVISEIMSVTEIFNEADCVDNSGAVSGVGRTVSFTLTQKTC